MRHLIKTIWCRHRANLDRLEWHCLSLEDFLNDRPDHFIDRYNLSDIFEYMSEDNYHQLLQRLVQAARPGSRLAYWNMLVPRTRPAAMANQLRPLTGLARERGSGVVIVTHDDRITGVADRVLRLSDGTLVNGI